MIPVSIAIATYNRSYDLERTLRSIIYVKYVSDENVEILLIDNNSTDGTRAIAEGFAGRFPGRFRYVREERQGLSHARNRAVAEARHDIVAFLDDDVEVDADWLCNLASAYESGDYAAVGGRAYLIYPGPRPRWLGERDEGYLTKVDYGPDRRPAGPDELFGVNLSLKKEWVERVGGFRADLGRIGTCLLGSEEAELLERIALAGGVLLYEPAAVVGHRVSPERLRRRWFWARSYWGQRGEIRRLPERQVSLYELARRTWHVALAGWDLARASIFHGPWGEECFHRTRTLAARLGSWVGLAGCLASRRRPGTPPEPMASPAAPARSGPRPYRLPLLSSRVALICALRWIAAKNRLDANGADTRTDPCHHLRTTNQ